MAKILEPTKEYFIDNCPIYPVENANSDPSVNLSDHPEYYAIEVFEDTRIDADTLSENNPVHINHTGIIKE